MNQPNYFTHLNQILKNYKRAIPSLLIDLDRLDQNIQVLQQNLQTYQQQMGRQMDFRLVVKSLPIPQLIHHISEQLPTTNFMVFHQPFLTQLSFLLNAEADILLGKPMPIKTATYYYETVQNRTNNFNPYQQIQWLVDTPERIHQYCELAKKLGQPLRLNIEIDVGLRRGGFKDLDTLKEGLALFQIHSKWIRLSGFMGYDAHVVKLPRIISSPQKALRKSNDFYRQCQHLLQTEFPDLWQEQLVFNGGGSPTVNLHLDAQNNSPINEVAAGSCLVKPTTFDISKLTNYQAACFIATPILKQFEGTTLPGIERFRGLLNWISKSNQRSYFIYGGYWKADYCYPKGTQQNALFGASTNQTMINAPKTSPLQVDDFVFLRPHQSEFVFLQFGKVLVMRSGEIVGEWGIFEG